MRAGKLAAAVLGLALMVTGINGSVRAEEPETAALTELQEDGAASMDTASVNEMEQAETETEEMTALPNGKQVYNLLLIGTDRRDGGWNGNSDVMIVASINEERQRVVMTSFMRDLYANIPGYGEHKLNYAFAAGGADTLIATLKDNFGLDIDNYAIVDFHEVAEIVDMFGGVQIGVTDAEVKVMNQYLSSMGVSEYALPCGGEYQLNGYQAVSYMRIRYVGNNDYQRTQRQRDVLSAIFESVQDLSSEELLKLAAGVTEKVEHDLSLVRMMKLMALVPQLTGYELDESRVPYDGYFTSRGEMLVPDYAETIPRIHEAIYGAGDADGQE